MDRKVLEEYGAEVTRDTVASCDVRGPEGKVSNFPFVNLLFG